MTRLLLLVPAISLLAACATPVSSVARPDAYYASAENAPAPASLFAGDETVLTDEAIARILQYDYEPPALSRIALLPFGREAWSTWSEELAVAGEQMRSDVLNVLRDSPQVYDASYLPSILIPDRKTVPHLREAAARYQADLLLVYRSYCRSFERYRLFAADRSRSYCGVEAVLLDTRTGLVPFTSVALEAFDASESESDLSFRETVLRAELEATSVALAAVSREIRTFLDAQ